MADDAGDEGLSAEEMRAAVKETEDLINGWYEQLPRDEAAAWVQAYREDLQRNREVAELELPLTEDVMSVTKGFRSLDEALTSIKAKAKRTAKEGRVLDAFERMRKKSAGS